MSPIPRVRVCGFHLTDKGILLLKHEGIGTNGFIWSPPGGGIEPGENSKEALKREFLEETGLTISVGNYLFTNEYIDSRFHAIELFFEVHVLEGEVQLGSDPEFEKQILTEARYLSYQEIDGIPFSNKHNAFRFCDDATQINKLTGYYIFENI